MTPDERLRAAQVTRDRMRELGLTTVELAQKAHLDPTTVRAILRGQRSPSNETRRKLAAALDWPLGAGLRRLHGAPVNLRSASTGDLIEELRRRCPDEAPRAAG